MSSSREIEHRSASTAVFSSTHAWLTPTQWRVVTNDDDMAEDVPEETKAVKCTFLSDNQSIRIAPMEKSRGGWDDEHFHTNLRIPEGSEVGRGMVVLLEGECVLVVVYVSA